MTQQQKKIEVQYDISNEVMRKYQNLQDILRKYKRLAVAFSGGVDSSFLIKVARDVLDQDVLGVTARSATFPEREYNEAVQFAKKWQIKHQTIVSEELDVDGFADNPKNRCFLCKSELFSKINDIAQAQGYGAVAEG